MECYRQLKKVKKANGEIIGVNVVSIYLRCPMQPSRGRRTGILTFADRISYLHLHCALRFFPL